MNSELFVQHVPWPNDPVERFALWKTHIVDDEDAVCASTAQLAVIGS
jgi:hypothetical protein